MPVAGSAPSSDPGCSVSFLVMRVRGTYILLLCVFFAAQLVGLCEAACLLLEMEHPQMQHGRAAIGVAMAASHAEHDGTRPADAADHADHSSATAGDAAHSGPPGDGSGEPHCPSCDGTGACSMDKTPLPTQASLTAGSVPPISLLVIEPVATDAPALVAAAGESLSRPPEVEPPRV